MIELLDCVDRCTACDCEPAGSLNLTCDAVTGSCFCKLFVEGRRCDTCIPGASYLNSKNPYGCSKGKSHYWLLWMLDLDPIH